MSRIEEMEALLVESKIPKMVSFMDRYETEDYPSGRHRVKAVWEVEHRGKKSRVARTTWNPKTGRPSKPKRTTYGFNTKIALGKDGRTYVVQYTMYDQIVVTAGTLKTTEYLHRGEDGYDELKLAIGIK